MRSLFFMLPLLARFILGGIFVWAGLAKIAEPALFAQMIRAYEVLPLPLIHAFAITVPWIEVLAGLLCLLGIWTRSSCMVILLLLVSFAGALGINIYRGADFSCGCFGFEGPADSLTFALVKNLVLIGFAVLLLRTDQRRFALDTLFFRASPNPESENS